MYAFVHIEKTAGSTLNTILRRSFGTRHCDIRLPLAKRRDDWADHKVCVEAADLLRVRRLYRNLRGIAGHNVKPYADLVTVCPEISYFTVLRDPVARYKSHFLNRGDGHTPAAFEEHLAAESTHNWQTKMIAGEANANKAIGLLRSRFGFVGLTERFDESLVMLREWMDDPALTIEYRSVNQLSDKARPRDLDRKKSDMSYLATKEARARMAEVNTEDQKVYDFVTSQIYPRQLAAFRGDLAGELRALQAKNRALAKTLKEPRWGAFMRNYIYKPLIHCYVC